MKHSGLLTVSAAAVALGVHSQTVRRWLRQGAPQARRGRRGRGCVAMLDVAAIRAWHDGASVTAALRAFAGEIPELVADACDESFAAASGPHKRALAGALEYCWYRVTLKLRDRLAADDPLIPEISARPEKIERLMRHFRGSC